MKYDVEQVKQFSVIGIRGLTKDEKYSVGDTCRHSYDWDYEKDCSSYDTENPIELDGTCATHIVVDMNWDSNEEIIEAIENVLNNFIYIGEKVLIGGYSFKYGTDDSEVIIEDAVVIAK